jgi:hypothetical protein
VRGAGRFFVRLRTARNHGTTNFDAPGLMITAAGADARAQLAGRRRPHQRMK